MLYVFFEKTSVKSVQKLGTGISFGFSACVSFVVMVILLIYSSDPPARWRYSRRDQSSSAGGKEENNWNNS